MFDDPNKRNLVAEVSTKEVVTYGKGNTPKIVGYDCGMKYNIIRYLVETQKVELTVVPFDYDLEANPSNIEWDGLFLSNGPGDPTMCSATIESIKYALALENPKPIFSFLKGEWMERVCVSGAPAIPTHWLRCNPTILSVSLLPA